MTTIRFGVLPTELSRSLSVSASRSLGAKSGAQITLVELSGADAAATQRAALLSADCDLAAIALGSSVGAAPEGLVLSAVPKRGDARDAFCAKEAASLDALPAGATVAVSSALRLAQIGHRRTDLRVVRLPGGTDALLAAFDAAEVDADTIDAIILSADELDRLGRAADATELLGLDGWPTAAGQGAIALEARVANAALASAIDHKPSHVIVEAERTVAELLADSVTAPLAVHGMIEDGLLFLSARVYSADGTETLTSSHALYVSDSPAPARDVATRVAEELLALGAAGLAAEVSS